MVWMNYADAVEKSRQDAEKAMTLASNVPDGYRVMSDLQSQAETNCPAAEQSLKRARELAPSDPDTLALNATLATCQGRLEEAVELTRQTLSSDPLRPREWTDLGQHLRDLGRYDEAHAALQRALDLNPQDAVMTHEVRGEVYLAQGRPQEALEEMEKEPSGWLHELGMALVYSALGRRKDSDDALATLILQYPDAAAYQIAQVYAYRGQVDQAFQWLERAYTLHDPGLMWFKTDLKLASLRRDPRYKQLLLRMNLA
jgi:tetratricopeptide (TPR) repeat protein